MPLQCKYQNTVITLAVCAALIGCSENIWPGPGDLREPALPDAVSLVTVSSTVIEISWNAVEGATGYALYRDTTAGGAYEIISFATDTMVADSALMPATSYYYRLRVWADRAYSPLSPAYSALTAAASPRGTGALAIDHEHIRVWWDPVKGAEEYNVLRRETNSNVFIETGVTSDTVLVDSGLSGGTLYGYAVIAVNAAGNSGTSDTVEALTMPAAPGGLEVSPQTPRSAMVRWNSSHGSSGYVLMRSADKVLFDSVTAISDTAVADTSLMADTRYFFAVKAYNSSGYSGLSNIDSVTTSREWATAGRPGLSAGEARHISICTYGEVPFVAFQDAGNLRKATVLTYDGSEWQTVGGAGFTVGRADFLCMSVNAGVPYMAFKDWGQEGKASLARYTGSAWEYVGGAGFSDSMADHTSLVFYETVPYVAYQDWNMEGRATVKKYENGGWAVVGGAGFSDSSAKYLSLAAGGDGTLYAAFRDAARNSGATVMKYDNSAWEVVGTGSFSQGEALYTSVVINGNVPYAAYRDEGRGGRLSIKKFNGVLWENAGSESLFTGAVDYVNLRIFENVLYAACYDWANQGGFVFRAGNAEWETVGGAVFGGSYTPSLSLAVSPQGIPWVAYGDANDNGRLIVKRY